MNKPTRVTNKTAIAIDLDIIILILLQIRT